MHCLIMKGLNCTACLNLSIEKIDFSGEPAALIHKGQILEESPRC